MANAASMLANSSQSGNTVNALDDWNPSDFWKEIEIDRNPGVDPWNPGGGSIQDPDRVGEVIDAGITAYEQYGYSYDPSTGMLTTPEGQFSPSILDQDPQTAASQGFNTSGMQQGQAEALTIAASFNDDLKKKGLLDQLNAPSVSGVGVDSTGGGGGGAGSGGDYGGGDLASGFGDYLAKMRRGLASKKDAVIAGKSKMLGGEMIGVKVDDIFAMVHRRYQAKRKTNDFIEAGAKPKAKGE